MLILEIPTSLPPRQLIKFGYSQEMEISGPVISCDTSVQLINLPTQQKSPPAVLYHISHVEVPVLPSRQHFGILCIKSKEN